MKNNRRGLCNCVKDCVQRQAGDGGIVDGQDLITDVQQTSIEVDWQCITQTRYIHRYNTQYHHFNQQQPNLQNILRFIVRSTLDSDLQRAKISLREYRKLIQEHYLR